MKIQLQRRERNLRLALPTGLIFSRFSLGLLLKSVEINGSRLDGLSPEAADRLACEVKRIQKNSGVWELLEVQSADGIHIRITL